MLIEFDFSIVILSINFPHYHSVKNLRLLAIKCPQLTFTCSKSTIEILEKDVKYV